MLKRPLLCGVLAFVIGQIIISRGNMTWGLGMIPIGFVIWCIRKRNQSGIMPFLLWLYLICLLLGGLNGMRCRMLSPGKTASAEKVTVPAVSVVFSNGMTVSQSAGTAAPVVMRTASPAATRPE